MDKVTQQNAAGAEECASASEELSAQAETVRSTVNDLVAVVGGSRTAARTVTRAADTGRQAKRAHAAVAHLHKEPPAATATAPAKAGSQKRSAHGEESAPSGDADLHEF
jgi:methyl-accepting chemotaxis protein